jgi:hypothetical protein
MKYITKLKLAAMHQLCDVEDRSTEFMIQYLQDTCKVDLDTVMEYLCLPQGEKNTLRREVNGFMEMFENIEYEEED